MILNQLKYMKYWKLKIGRICCFFLLGIALVACQPKEPSLPIPEEALVPVLKDIQLAESIIQQQTFNIQDSLVERYYNVSYRTHNIQAEDLDSTLAILRKEPAIMDRVYTKVLEELSKEEVRE